MSADPPIRRRSGSTAVRDSRAADNQARLDKPWRRPGAFGYALKRVAGIIQPPVTVTEPVTPMIIDHDVPVTVRDGLHPARQLLPAHNGRAGTSDHVRPPIRQGPTPTRRGPRSSYSFQYRVLRQTGPVAFSTLTSWEAPDPDWWVAQGYAVINCDLRGAGTSDGFAEILSEQEGKDFYDLIEWAAAQPWSTGKIGLLGVSYLALTQWRAASLQPPSLPAICPWEGFTDAYRDLMRPGGIPETGFLKLWARGMKSVRQQYAIIDRQMEHPFRDDWWKSLVPDLSRVTVPTLVCGSFSDNNLHSRGSIRGFQMINSSERHLYTHRSGKWVTFYAVEARQTQRAFFDRHLRSSSENPPPPTVRLEVRTDRDTVTAVRGETAWPLPETRWTDLYLDIDGLRETRATVAGHLGFPVTARGLSFGYTFSTDAELTGPMTGQLWVEVHKTDDADLFVGVEKWVGHRYVPFEGPTALAVTASPRDGNASRFVARHRMKPRTTTQLGLSHPAKSGRSASTLGPRPLTSATGGHSGSSSQDAGCGRATRLRASSPPRTGRCAPAIAPSTGDPINHPDSSFLSTLMLSLRTRPAEIAPPTHRGLARRTAGAPIPR
jgi:uncharacterized protein